MGSKHQSGRSGQPSDPGASRAGSSCFHGTIVEAPYSPAQELPKYRAGARSWIDRTRCVTPAWHFKRLEFSPVRQQRSRMSPSHGMRSAVLLGILLAALPAAPTIAADGSGARADRREHAHSRHHSPRHIYPGRRHRRTSLGKGATPRVTRDAAPVAHPPAIDPWAQDSDTIRYGYVNTDCPKHLDSPHRGTPDGFWYTEFGQRLPCY